MYDYWCGKQHIVDWTNDVKNMNGFGLSYTCLSLDGHWFCGACTQETPVAHALLGLHVGGPVEPLICVNLPLSNLCIADQNKKIGNWISGHIVYGNCSWDRHIIWKKWDTFDRICLTACVLLMSSWELGGVNYTSSWLSFFHNCYAVSQPLWKHWNYSSFVGVWDQNLFTPPPLATGSCF